MRNDKVVNSGILKIIIFKIINFSSNFHWNDKKLTNYNEKLRQYFVRKSVEYQEALWSKNMSLFEILIRQGDTDENMYSPSDDTW